MRTLETSALWLKREKGTSEMRGFWIGLGVLLAIGCGDDFADRPAGAGGHGGGHAGSGGAGRATVAGTGGNALSAGVGGTVSGTAGLGAAGRAVADGGQPNDDAGVAGTPGDGSAGAPTDEAGAGGELSSAGGDGVNAASAGAAGTPGVAGGPPVTCDCDAAHDCVAGECVIKPECDCESLKVACGPLSTAMRLEFACPIEVQCGECGTGHLCVGTNDEATYGRRICEAPAASSCKPWTTYIEPRGWPPVCPPPSGGDARCSVPYLSCTRIYLLDGTACPMPDGIDQSLAVFCGPQL